MRAHPIIVSLFLLFLCLPVYAKDTILVLGDSLSAAYGFDSKDGWVELLKQRLEASGADYQVINASVSGATTAQGLSHLPDLLKKYQPTLTIIELAGNDALLGIQPWVIKMNLTKIIRLVKASDSKVLLLSIRVPPNYGKPYNEALLAMYQTLAENEKITVVPLYTDDIEADNQLLQADKIHPTKAAQPIIMDRLWKDIQTLLN